VALGEKSQPTLPCSVVQVAQRPLGAMVGSEDRGDLLVVQVPARQPDLDQLVLGELGSVEVAVHGVLPSVVRSVITIASIWLPVNLY
jgi:hypothetical protein